MKRAKQDIMLIGGLHDGLPVYRFRYTDDLKTWHIGLLAEDVSNPYPHAVKDGVVDNDLATRSSAVNSGHSVYHKYH